MGEDGQLLEGVQMLAELGFQVGMHVMRKADKVKGQITQMTGNLVTLEVHDGPITGTAQISADGFRKGQWKVSKEREKPLEIESCHTYSAFSKSKDISLKIVQGKVAAALMAHDRRKVRRLLAWIETCVETFKRCGYHQAFQQRSVDVSPHDPKNHCHRPAKCWYGLTRKSGRPQDLPDAMLCWT